MSVFFRAVFAIFLLSVSGCEKAADVSAPIAYKKGDIHFSYPGNWTVSDDTEQDGMRYLIVESPGDALLIVQVYGKQQALTSLSEYVRWFSAQSRKNIAVGSVAESDFFDIETQDISMGEKGIRERFSIVLLGERVPHVRDYYMMEMEDKVAFLVAQSATDDMGKVTPGFKLILNSIVIE